MEDGRLGKSRHRRGDICLRGDDGGVLKETTNEEDILDEVISLMALDIDERSNACICVDNDEPLTWSYLEGEVIDKRRRSWMKGQKGCQGFVFFHEIYRRAFGGGAFRLVYFGVPVR